MDLNQQRNLFLIIMGVVTAVIVVLACTVDPPPPAPEPPAAIETKPAPVNARRETLDAIKHLVSGVAPEDIEFSKINRSYFKGKAGWIQCVRFPAANGDTIVMGAFWRNHVLVEVSPTPSLDFSSKCPWGTNQMPEI